MAKNKKVDTLVLYKGYVESQSLMALTLYHNVGFPTALEAVENLALIVESVYNTTATLVPEKCGGCGQKIKNRKHNPINDEGFLASKFEAFMDSNMDEMDHNLYDRLEEKGWSIAPHTAKPKGFTATVLHAPECIETAAVGVDKIPEWYIC